MSFWKYWFDFFNRRFKQNLSVETVEVKTSPSPPKSESQISVSEIKSKGEINKKEKTSPKKTASNESENLPQKKSPELPSYLEEQEDQAKRLITIAISRQATQFVSHVTTSRVKLSSSQLKEGIKGKIVGKDGRNARHFEEKAGVDLLLNDEPDAVLISSFDPFRREVARLALESLVRDGRIHLAKIEEALAESRAQVDKEVKEAGKNAAQGLGISDLHPAIVRVLGTLKFRLSFGQNQLEHSIETAGLCGSLASELGLNVMLAKRAGLLHDLGKGLDQTHDGGHALAGAAFAKRYGESEAIVQAISAHHEEIQPYSWLDHLVLAADALSGARPGARHGSTQIALERATQMEKIAQQTPGVQSAFAVKAGREIRVFVDSQQVQDSDISPVAKRVADRIGAEVQFPGQIKVIVLREIRAVEVVSR